MAVGFLGSPFNVFSKCSVLTLIGDYEASLAIWHLAELLQDTFMALVRALSLFYPTISSLVVATWTSNCVTKCS